jgi:hypothetical protein
MSVNLRDVFIDGCYLTYYINDPVEGEFNVSCRFTCQKAKYAAS